MNVHKNARLTPRGRERVVRQVESGQTPEAVAEAAWVCPRTVRKWVDRYRHEGSAGLRDRSSWPHRLRRPTPQGVIEKIVRLRKQSAVAFLEAAVAYFANLSIRIERAMTDNGSCYRSKTFRAACKRSPASISARTASLERSASPRLLRKGLLWVEADDLARSCHCAFRRPALNGSTRAVACSNPNS